MKKYKSETRFKFGKNWLNFLKDIDDNKINEAKLALIKKLNKDTLVSHTFLDIGSGSGLHSLCARRLGAKVVSFDYDQQSVECTKILKERYFKDDVSWTIFQGSVLDEKFMKDLGKYDVVYSWGVLHHTGNMWKALELAESCVNSKGTLFIALYNDQENVSDRWKIIKKTYNKYLFGKVFWTVYYFFRWVVLRFIKDLLTFKNPMDRHKNYSSNRGMSYWYDIVDWIGGYPFEVAKPEDIFYFFKSKGYHLLEIKTCGRFHGCNEYVFKRLD